MTTNYPKCHSDNPDTQSFCGDCGTQLGPPKDFPAHTKTLETPYPQFSPGTSLAQRYKIISELGKGGMGEVYLAEDTNLKRQVAIKVLPQPFALDQERLARFEREARLLASLNHPNIATIHGLEKSDGQQFLIMELVEGDTLADRIKKGPLPMDEALEVCKQIAEGLESAEISEIERFSTASQLHSYAGVIPSTHASGDKLYHGRLVQRGNKWLRWAAVEAVWPAIRSDFDIRLYYQRIKKRKGANSAKVATARRLLAIIYRVMKEKRAYIPYKREKHTAAFARI